MDITSLVEAARLSRERQISLVASENALSPRALWALSSDLHNRYLLTSDKPDSVWDYPNQEHYITVHDRVCALANGIYGSEHADVRPLSGNNAAYVLINSLAEWGDTIFHVPADCGGHFATEPICRREGIELVDIPFDREKRVIRFAELAALYREKRPRFVFLDASMILFPHPLEQIRSAVGDEAVIAYDASQVFGLIGGGRFQDPFDEGADILNGSTHKTLFGPQKGMILTRERELGLRISKIVMPLFVSNVHLHHIAALGVALEEIRAYGPEYARQTVDNARILADRLHAGGIEVFAEERGFTESHQLWCEFSTFEQAKEAFNALEEIGICTNLIRVPMTDRFGLRMGTAEITRRGFRESDVRAVGGIVLDLLVRDEPAAYLRERVAELAMSRPGLRFCDDPDGM